MNNIDPDVLERVRFLESRVNNLDKDKMEQDKKIQEQDRKISEQNQKIQEYEAKYNDYLRHRDSVQNKQIIIIGVSFLGGLFFGHYSTKSYYSFDQRPIPR